jgi:coproporphyrinogen III oxidase
MGSLPACVDRDLLRSWVEKMDAPQDELLKGVIAVLPDQSPVLVDEAVKQSLAAVLRNHYTVHPEAIAMQASGDTVVPTVDNHR